MIKKLALALLVCSLAACSGTRVTTLIADGLVPEITHLEGIKQSIYVGDTMTSSAPLLVIGTAALKTDLIATTSHRDNPITLKAAPGTYTLIRQNAQGKFYEGISESIKLNDSVVPGGLFLANEGMGNSALYWSSFWSHQATPDRQMAMHIAELSAKPNVSISNSKQPPNNLQGFVATLDYMGMASGQIKFVYREYTNGLARAAFTQEVSLDYEAGKTYAYKSARFIVHDANTADVTFTLLQSL